MAQPVGGATRCATLPSRLGASLAAPWIAAHVLSFPSIEPARASREEWTATLLAPRRLARTSGGKARFQVDGISPAGRSATE